MGLAFTLILILGTPLSTFFGPLPLRIVFWVLLGLASAWTFQVYGITPVILVILAMMLVNLAARGGRETLRLVIESLAVGAKNALPVGIACALVGVLIGVLALTGTATTFTRVIVAVGENSLFLSLLLTMITCLILGMGIPTIPNYIITSSIAGPALLELGVPLIVSHMFVFYFGIMADLTPPFMAVYSPTLMLQPGGPLAEAIGFWPAVAYNLFKVFLAIGLWGAASIGFFGIKLSWWERLWAFGGAALMIAALPVTDELGIAVSLAFLAWTWWRLRQRRRVGTVPT